LKRALAGDARGLHGPSSSALRSGTRARCRKPAANLALLYFRAMIGPLFVPEACRKVFAAIDLGAHDGDVALDRTAFDLTGRITITETANKDQINKRLEIMLG
jgi:hypothetical protein